MNRTEFMNVLAARLAALNDEDRNDALRYYDELFDEAGPIEEQKILDDLGDPNVIARQILADNGIAPDGPAQFMIDDAIAPGSDRAQAEAQRGAYTQVSQENKTLKIVLIVLILVITAPVWGGLVGGLIGLIAGLFGVIIALIATLTVGGVAMLIAGIIRLFSVPPIGLCEMGLGLILIGIGILTIVPFCKWLFKACAAVVRWAVGILRKLFKTEHGV